MLDARCGLYAQHSAGVAAAQSVDNRSRPCLAIHGDTRNIGGALAWNCDVLDEGTVLVALFDPLSIRFHQFVDELTYTARPVGQVHACVGHQATFMAGIHGLEHVERLAAANLTNYDS